MAKTVFAKTADVAAQWAKGELEHARTGSNTTMRDGVLRSYETPIAAIVTDPAGTRVALISSKQWSSGTSKVQGEAYGAARDLDLAIYRVPRLGCALDDIQANLAHYAQAIAETLDKLQRGRVTSAASYRQAAGAMIATARGYAERFAVAWAWEGPDPATVKHPKE